ncbi:MAG: metallophosphoesterase [Cyanobacteria bacterium P01_A01_bin.135]
MIDLRFGVATDLHIALPHTVPPTTNRFHRTEYSVAAFEAALATLSSLNLDLLLLCGDLTQDGEVDNHRWLAQRLGQLPYPVYVIPGNHDIVTPAGTAQTISAADFRRCYAAHGYADTDQLYYSQLVAPGVRLIGLNSIFFEGDTQTYRGRLDAAQLEWLTQTLEESGDELVIVMVHHNVLEHLPGQSQSRLGQRYMLENAPALLEILSRHGVQLVFTGHLHVQDVAHFSGTRPIYDIATGSTVSYPHPFRVLHYREAEAGAGELRIETHRVQRIPGVEDLQQQSREFMGDRSYPFIKRLLTDDPLSLDEAAATALLPALRYLWADIAHGDAQFKFPQFTPTVRQYFERFSCRSAIDNQAILQITRPTKRPTATLPLR